MNIIRLTTRIYPDIGGPAVYTYLLSKHISDKNFRIFNVTCKPERNFESIKFVNSNFIINYLPIIVPSYDKTIVKKLTFIFKFILHSIKKILELHRKHRIDLIHCDNPAITGLISIVFKKIFKIPYIYTQHGLESPYKLEYLLELGLIHRFSTYYVIISRRMIKFFEKNNVSLEKILWIPNGVELNKYYHAKNEKEKQEIINDLGISSITNPNDYVIIYVGYMTLKQKVLGMIDFLHGFNKFLNDLNEEDKKRLKLLYIGDGLYIHLLKNELDKLNLKNNVFLLGVKKDMEKYYAISDLCALTSYIEGFSTVLLEAIASQVPCISTEVGEAREILDSDSLVPIGDRDKIASKLKRFYKEKEFNKRIVEVSSKKIKKFDWITISKNIKRIYYDSIRKKLD